MHNINLQGLLRSVSVIIIFLIVFLYIMLNTKIDNIVLESNDTQPGKEYEYGINPKSMSIPGFSYDLELLFPRQLIPVLVDTIIVSETIVPVDIPSLKFVGMIETDEAIIYSFRNEDTNRLLLLEEGIKVTGITLLSARATGYTLKKNETAFQVVKK